jgi:ubiquinone/menaquinone biosynthesis C-methylase UbiE/uncharacterized protein YbaR (Trm112 family)
MKGLSKNLVDPDFLKILECLVCRGELSELNNELVCTKCEKKYPIINGFPVLLSDKMSEDVSLSRVKFDQKYVYADEDFKKYIEYLKNEYVFYSQSDLEKLPDNRGGKFLELGCGGGVSGLVMAKKGYKIFGVDYSIGGLELSRRVFESFGVEAYFACADLTHSPFKNNSFDAMFGGGTIEHMKDTQSVIDELYRITAPGGVCLNTVPVVSLSSLTYRQLSGNIPDLPVLKQIFEFIHIRVLNGRFMHTGYEKSFLEGSLKRMHSLAGFSIITVTKYNFVPALEHFPNWLKGFLRKLENHRLFWTAVTVRAEK